MSVAPTTADEFGTRSSFTTASWQRAIDKLNAAGFGEDTMVILHAAFFNSLDPERFARAAIQLRKHVADGLPLS